MSTLYTVDASVFLNAFNVYEEGHIESAQFVQWLETSQEPIIAPTLLLPEISASIGRVYQDSALALEFAEGVRDIPHLTLIPLNEVVGWHASEIAADLKVRGSDAVYIAVAQRYGAILVTLDKEKQARAATAVTALSPAEVLATLPPSSEDTAQ